MSSSSTSSSSDNNVEIIHILFQACNHHPILMSQQDKSSNQQRHIRCYIQRDWVSANGRLMEDYFANKLEYPAEAEYFKHRFRMK